MRYGDIAPELFDNGWHNVIPLSRGKAPCIKWGDIQHRDMTERTLEWAVANFGWAPRTGVVFGTCREIVAIDIDVEEEASVKRVLTAASDYLPPTDYVRIGRAPKRLLLYSGRVKSRKLHPIEIFGSSGQCAVFGKHPTAGNDYYWPLSSIEEIGPADLPRIDEMQIAEFLKHCERNVRVFDRKGHPVDWVETEELRRERVRDGLDAVKHQLNRITEGKRHIYLLSNVGYLMHKVTKDEAWEIVDEWFPQSERTEQFADLWDVFETMWTGKWDPDWEIKDDEEASP